MSRLDAIRHRLAVLLRSRLYAREMEAERRFHIELEAMQQRHAGADEDDAEFAARRQFGNVTYFGEETRRMTSLPIVDALVQDLRYALRTLRRSPGFTLAVVLTLALGIGANTAIFSVVNRLLLHPLPYKDADRIVSLGRARADGDHTSQFTPTLDLISAWKTHARSLDGVEAYWQRADLETGAGDARIVLSNLVTPGLAAFLGVRPVFGRTFVSADTASGAPPVVLISDASWRRDFGGSTDVLGRTIVLDSIPHVIVGVMPAHWLALNLLGPGNVDEVWLPLSLAPGRRAGVPPLAYAIAHLRSGSTPEQAERELDAIAVRLPSVPMRGNVRFVASVLPARQRMISPMPRGTLLILLGAVGLVLAVACANVANLLLARGTARAREVALRAALGASRWRLVRHVLTEGIILSLAGGVLGALLAWWGLRAITALRPDNLDILTSVRLDSYVLRYTLIISIATGVCFTLIPALHSTSPSRTRALRSSGSGVVRRSSGGRFRAVLVGGEMTLAVLLLVGAGLLIRSVAYLQHRDIGFNARGLITMSMTLPRGRYAQPASRELFAQQMLDRLRATPGVVAATQALGAPPDYAGIASGLEIYGRAKSEGDEHISYSFDLVQPDYFRMIGLRPLAGRTFTEAEMRTGDAVIIDEAIARRFWPDGSAIGHRLRTSSRSPWKTIVGVVGDVAGYGLMEDSHFPQVYEPFRAAATLQPIGAPPQVDFIVRAAADPASVIAAIRPLTRSIDPEVVVSRIDLVESQFADSIAGPRFNMTLLTVFAALALALATVGLAAVVGYAVTERTHEIGIRMALGAQEASVLRLVITQGMRAVIFGLMMGLLGALAATRLLSSMLYGVESRDPLTFIGVAALLLLVAFVASWLPARRATRVDPIIALRAE